jgi:hypothetical protein
MNNLFDVAIEVDAADHAHPHYARATAESRPDQASVGIGRVRFSYN